MEARTVSSCLNFIRTLFDLKTAACDSWPVFWPRVATVDPTGGSYHRSVHRRHRCSLSVCSRARQEGEGLSLSLSAHSRGRTLTRSLFFWTVTSLLPLCGFTTGRSSSSSSSELSRTDAR